MDHDDFWLDDDLLDHGSFDHGSFDHGLFDHDPAEPDPWPELPEPDEYQPDGYQVEDLDLPAHPDPDGVFPPMLDLPDLPEPVDGPPWIDVSALAAAPGGYEPALADPGPAELAAYAGEETADWAALRAAEDPATAALARFWSG